MASYFERKDSPYFWIRYRLPDGRWKQKSSGIRTDAPNARKRVARLAHEATGEEKIQSVVPGANFSVWVTRWMAYQYPNKKTLHRYQNAWVALESFFKSRKVKHPAEVTYQMCHEYLAWRSDAERAKEEKERVVVWNTALTEVRVLGAILQEAVRRGYITSNPCARLGVKRRNTKEKREFTSEEIEKIERALPGQPQWMQDCWVVAMRQGCRLAEVEVPLGRVNLTFGTITFRVKGGRDHDAPLHADVERIARRRIEEGEALLVELGKSPSKRWINFFMSLGIKGISLHSTRVTVITRLARAGFSEAKTMDYIGHCSREVHSVYRKLKAVDLRDVGRALG